MDKVQIYYTCLMMLSIFMYGINHDKERTRTTNAFIELPLVILFSLPTMGRIYGWW